MQKDYLCDKAMHSIYYQIISPESNLVFNYEILYETAAST